MDKIKSPNYASLVMDSLDIIQKLNKKNIILNKYIVFQNLFLY